MTTPKCTKQTARLLIDYFSRAPYTESIDTVWHSNGAARQEALKRVPNPLPTFEGFAAKIGVSVRRLRRWEEELPMFREACERARDLQRDFLIQNALLGLYNAAFARIVAAALCDMQDAQRVKLDAQAFIIDDILPPLDDFKDD